MKLKYEDFLSVKKEHVLEAIKHIDEYGYDNPSRKYKVIYKDKEYPPKNLLELARIISEGKYIGGIKLNTSFSPKIAERKLIELGFDVVIEDTTIEDIKGIFWDDLFSNKFDDYNAIFYKDNSKSFFINWVLNSTANLEKISFSVEDKIKLKKPTLIFVYNKRYEEFILLRAVSVVDHKFIDFDDDSIIEKVRGRVSVIFNNKSPNRNTIYKLSQFKDRMYINKLYQNNVRNLQFPGFYNIMHSYRDLKKAYKIDEWREQLSSVNAVYLITDTSSNKSYIGYSFNTNGLYGRWNDYLDIRENNFLPNKELKKLHKDEGIDYINDNLEFCILEILTLNISKEEALKKESRWKNILYTRETGLNRN